MRIKSVLMNGALSLLLASGIGCGGKSAEDEESASTTVPAAAKKSVDQATAGSIAGKVVFTGTAPKMNKIDMAAEATCSAKHTEPARDQSVVVNGNGTLKNVVVYVKQGLEEYTFPAPSQTPEIDQVGCVYEPHVLVMMPGMIKIKSSDNVLHNVHAEPKTNQPFNQAQPTPSTIEKKLTKPEVAVPFKCDVHPWMRAYVAVIEHPVAVVTGNDGTFKLSPLPPGQYVLEAWHEKYGMQQATVTVETGKTAEATFTFSAPGA